MPGIPQKVKFFTARTTFIAESSLEEISAINFDAEMMRLFEDIPAIDRAKWEMADRLFALNAALSQTEERKTEGLPYLRLDDVQNGQLQLSIIEPVEPEQAEDDAIKTQQTDERYTRGEEIGNDDDESDKLQLAIDLLRRNPNATDEDVRVALGLRTHGVGRFWKIKARQVIEQEET